jgi:hypothetical protein
MTDAMPDDSLKGRRDRAMVMLRFAGAFPKSEVIRPAAASAWRSTTVSNHIGP